jgi:RNA polymerase sigma-32 factor
MSIENKNLLPVITSENDIYPYLKKINQFPMLTDEEEKKLAIDWLKNGNTKAAQKLVTSHLRLVAKIAMGYRGYGLPLFDLISEGNLGLIQAIRKFDPDKGFRLATYAIWWIRASIQEYVLHSWSLVKIGTTAAQKKLFFNLRRLRNQLKKYEEGYLTNDQIKSISQDLGVTEDEVKQMEGRVFNQDFSLNTPLNDENDSEWIDQVEDDNINVVTRVEERDELDKRKALYNQAVKKLEPRELEILTARRLDEEPKTLEDLSQKYSISRERVRQIENKAIKKLQEEIKLISETKLLPKN